MSGASVSSFASSADASTSGALRVSGLTPEGDDGVFEEAHTLQLGVFGVLYTVSKEKQLTSVKFAFFRLALDFLQLWLLVVNPSYGWAINAKNRVWQVVSFIQLNAFLSARGYTFFLALLYVFIGLLGMNLALSIWVANSFSNNRFEYVWPIQFLRWFGLIFYQVLDIATLTLLLVTLDCNYFNVPATIKFHNQEFPQIMCWSMPHIVHVAVSVASIVMFVLMATCQVVSEMELNPLTRNYMAIAHTRVEGMGFAIKTVVTIASVTIATSTKALAVAYLFFFSLLFYMAVKWVPYVYSALNYVRCASYGTVLYSSVLLAVMAFGPSGSRDEHSEFRARVTWALWAGMAPAAAAGALACHLRLRHFKTHVLARFRDAEPGAASKSIHRFSDAREVEIAARCCRRWLDEDTLEPEAVALSEQVIKAGMLQLPQDAQMIILYSSFLIDVQGSYQSGYTQLQTAKKQSPGLLERFAIFSREQEHTQKASGANNGGGDSAVDLVSYVEFQRNHRLVVRAHREALLAMRSFWGLLLRTNVNFNHLSRALHRIEVSVKAAERAYRGVLARHGSSARLVRLYGRFLETVKFDPWAASKWYSEADRLEEEAEHTREALQLGGMETLLPQGVSADRGLAEMEGVSFICINAQGIIQVASPEAHAMLGYAKNELKGKDVGIIMPPPFGDRHSAYVRNYIQTGTSAVLDRTSEMVVLTKGRQVIPVKLRVTKVSGLNEDSVFLGVMEAVPPSPDEARAWILGNGTLIAADDRFCDWLGYEGPELGGAALEGLLLEPEPLREAIKAFSRPHAAAGAAHGRIARRRSSNFSAEALIGAVPSLLGDRGDKLDARANGGGGGGGLGPDGKPAWLRRNSFGSEHAGPSVHGPLLHNGGGGGADWSGPQAAVAALRAAWRHKFSAPLAFDTFLQPGAFGSVKVHSVVIRRCSQSTALLPFAAAATTEAQAQPRAYAASQAAWPLPRITEHIAATTATAPASDSRGHDLRRCPPHYDDMLLVADVKGRVLHVTAALAAALGRSAEAIRAGGLGLLIPEPASILHGPWLQELGNPQSSGPGAPGPAPPHSCRSGVAVSLCTTSEESGPGVKPFRLQVVQRLAEGGGSKIHVVSLTPLSVEQALSERRLRLSVDLTGTILSADAATPPELFGADPRVMVGRSVAQVIDVFRPDTLDEVLLGQQAAAAYSPNSPAPVRLAPAAASVRGATGGGGSGGGVGGEGGGGEGDDVLEGAEAVVQAAFARRLTKALLELARRSSESPGCSWRVGVHVPPDEQAASELQQLAALLGPDDAELAAQFLGAKTVPAVMRVRLARRQRTDHPDRAAAPPASGPYPQAGGDASAQWQPPGRTTSEERGSFLLAAVPVAEARVGIHSEIQAFGAVRGAARSGAAWRGGLGPVAEATEPAAAAGGGEEEASRAVLDEADVAALEELADVINATPPPASPLPPAAPATAAAAALAAAVAAAADRSRQVSRIADRSQHGHAHVDVSQHGRAPPAHRPSGALPPPQPTYAESAATATPGVTKPPAQQLASQVPTRLSPRPADRASPFNAPQQNAAREGEARPRPSQLGVVLLSRPVSLRLPPDTAAAAPTAPRGAAVSASVTAAAAAAVAAPPPPPPAVVAPSLVLEIELWRADLLSGVLEVDDKGRVLRADASCPLGQSALVLGAPPSSLLSSSVSDLMPLPPGGVAALLDAGSGDPAGSAVRGALKRRASRQAKAGPQVTLAARHGGDGCELALTVQAVRRAGPSGSAFLLLRPSAPAAAAQPGFVRWLYDGDTTGLMMPYAEGRVGVGGALALGSAASLWPGVGARATSSGGADGRLPAPPSALGPHAARAADVAASAAATAAATGYPHGYRKAATITGLSSMTLVDQSAAGAAAVAAGIHHSYSVTGIGAIDARLPQARSHQPVMPALLAAAGAPPPPPPSLSMPPVSVEAAALSPMRIAAMRGAAAAAAAAAAGGGVGGNVPATPSRLSVISTAEAEGGGPDCAEAAAAAGLGGAGSAAGPRKSTSTGLSSAIMDTAYEDSPAPCGGSAPLAAGRTTSLPRRQSSSGLSPPALAAALRSTESPRQSALLLRLPGETDAGPMRPSSKLSPKKHNMVHSWVLHGHGPGSADPGGREAPLSPIEQDPGGVHSDAGSDGSRPTGDALSADGADNGSADGADGAAAGAVESGGGLRPAGTDDSGRDGGTEQELESEAGAVVANYSVGKRFKKLYKILTSPLAQQPARRLRWQMLGVAAVILVAHTVTFVLLLTQLLQQQAAVKDLNSVAMASRRVHEIAINGRLLDRLYSGNSYVEGLPQFGDPVDDALADTLDDTAFVASSLKELHHGVYLGFRSLRRISTGFGLRDIWDSPRLNITLFYDADDPANPSALLASGSTPPPTTIQLGLWDAGNLYLAKALDMYNNAPSIVRQGANFTNWSTWRFIHANGLSVIFPAYQATLDALVQLTVAKSRDIYTLQLIVLCLEGGLLCLMACAYVWYAASKFSKRRYNLYGVFVQIPLGITRGLANMSLKLEATEDDEEDEAGLPIQQDAFGATDQGGAGGGGSGGEAVLTDGAVKAAASGHAHQAAHSEPAGGRPSGHRRRNSVLNFSLKGGIVGPGEDDGSEARPASASAAAAVEPGRPGPLRSLGATLGALAFWRGRAKVTPQTRLGKSRRLLVPSQRLAYALVAPFVLWGVAVVIVNLVGYNHLKAMTAPIATLNVVNTVLVRAHRMIFYTLEVAAALTLEACTFYKSVLRSEVLDLQLEYAAMLYGNEAVPNSDSPHFRLATTGVVFGGFDKPAQLLYSTDTCLCNDPEACQPAGSALYQVTHNGLDVLLKTQFGWVESLVVQPAETSGLNSTEFRSMWSTGQTDMEGGVTKMSSVFLDEVQGSYNQVVVQQIAMFCVAWVWGLAFLALQLRPLLRRTHGETRRIAELLSQLPAEVDCEALVTAVILGEHGHAMPAGAGAGAGRHSTSGAAASGSAHGGGSAHAGKLGRVSEPGPSGGLGYSKAGATSKSGRSFERGVAPAGSIKQRHSAVGYPQSADLPAGKDGI